MATDSELLQKWAKEEKNKRRKHELMVLSKVAIFNNETQCRLIEESKGSIDKLDKLAEEERIKIKGMK